jgi:HlyD family secretion protein
MTLVTVRDAGVLPGPGSNMAIPGSQPRFLSRHWGKLAVALSVLAGVIVVRSLPVAVERQVVAPGTVVCDILGTGTLDARTRATVGAKIAGRMAEILADQGDQVKKDQVLARIDAADLRRQASAAEAAWRASQSSVARAKADQARAQAVADQAQRDRKRLEPLRESNIISVESLEQAGERLAIALADIGRSDAAITEAEQQAAAAEETLRMYQARLAEATIVAPFDGLVVRRFREVGDVVVPGTAVMLVVATDTLWISAWLDESAMTSVAVGQQARILFRSNPRKADPPPVLWTP